jgi:glycosyltransferase involved in cell wall biosynthesis
MDTLRLVKRLGANRGHLTADTAVPPGYADHAAPRTLTVGETLRIVWVGRLFPIKGLRLALEALSSVRDVPWHLTIVGGGRLAPEVPGWLRELTIESRVDWLGQISWREVKDAYQKAHIMLFSSLRDSMGAQLYEALGSGLPVVALNHHGARDMLPGSAAVKVDVGTPQETIGNLSTAIRHINANPETVHQMSEAALEFAATHTWEKKVQETYELIEQSFR